MPDPTIDINSLKKTVESGALLDSSYDKFRSGDSYFRNSNSYVADQAYKDAYKQALKEQSLKLKNDYNKIVKENGMQDEVENPNLAKSFFDDMISNVKSAANFVANNVPGTAAVNLATGQNSDVFNQTAKKTADDIRAEVVGAYDENKAFDRAIKNGVVKTVDGKKVEYTTLEENLRIMDDADFLDRIKYGLGMEQNKLGGKKLTISDGNSLTDWFYYLDKDEDGNDILAKTRIQNYDQFKKDGKKILGAYGATPFNQGFMRELGAGLTNTYSSLAGNLVNANRALANLVGGWESSGDLAKSWAKGATEYGKQFRASQEINSSKPGQGGTAEWFGGGLGQGASSLAQMAILGTITGGLGRVIAPAASATDKFNAIANFGAGSILNFNEAYSSALDSGMSEKEAASIGALTGSINGLIESAVGTNRLFNWMSGGGDKAIARSVINELGGDVSEKSINRVFDSFRKGLTGDAGAFLSRVFEKPVVGAALEEGVEEMFQTFSQKGVENLYDVLLASDKKVGEGKFGSKLFSKETAMEALESAFFGAILGGGGDITRIASEKITGKKSYKENDIIPMIAAGKGQEIEAVVKTMHNGGIISDQQKDAYLQRVTHLNNLFDENKGMFTALDGLEDKDRVRNIKTDALDLVDHVFSLNKSTNTLAKQLNEVQNNADLSDVEKTEKSKELTEKIRQNKLNIKFYNDYITSEFKPNEAGKVNAYEHNYLNQKEVLNNKWQRFLNIEGINNIQKDIDKNTSIRDRFQERLDSNDISEGVSAKEAREAIETANANISYLEDQIKDRERTTLDLIDEFNEITSAGYQARLQEGLDAQLEQEAEEEAEVTTTTPIDALPEEKLENNSNVQEEVETAPVSKIDQLTKTIADIQEQLQDENLDPETINKLMDVVDFYQEELDELQANKGSVEEDYNTFLRENNNIYEATLEAEVDNDTKQAALSKAKKDIEQTMAGFKSNGIDTSALQDLHTSISNDLISLRETIKNDIAEQARLEEEAKTASERDDTPLVSNISFFDKIARFERMDTLPDFWNQSEFEQILLETPIEDILDNSEIRLLDTAVDLGLPVGGKIGTWNNNTDIVNPKYVYTLRYKGKGLGNFNQIDSFTVTDSRKDANITPEQLRAVEARNIKLLALLQRFDNRLLVQDLNAIGFNLQWYGKFSVDSNTPRTLVKDFKLANLVGKSGKPFYYIIDTGSNNREITSLVDTVQDELGEIPNLPDNLEDRYQVLVKANNGKLYWVGAQNQVLKTAVQDDLYRKLFSITDRLKNTENEQDKKELVSNMNRYLEENIFLASADKNRQNKQLQLTTPNKTNKDYTLAIKGTKGKNSRVVLDASLYPTMSDLLGALGLTNTNLRTTFSNSANINEVIGKLSINVNPTVLESPRLSFSINDDLLNDYLVNATATPTEAPITSTTEEDGQENIEESDNPFAGYDSDTIDPSLDQDIVAEVVTADIDLNQFDSGYNSLDESNKAKITAEVQPLLQNFLTANNFQKKAIEIKVRAIINKYKPISGDPVFSIGNSPETMDYPAAVEWLNNNLPNSITVEDVSRLMGNIKNNGTTFGAFANNIIYLSQTAAKGTQYHEAFHAVFRMLISDKQINAAYNIAADKYGRPTKLALDKLKASSSVYDAYTESQLTQLFYEESMANEFQQYMLNNDRSTSGIKSIWNKIKNWFNFVLGNMDQMQALFYNISRGAFKDARIQSNIFSRAATQDAVFQVYKKGLDENGMTISTTQKEGQGILASLTNKFLQQVQARKIGKYDTEAKGLLLDELLDEKANFYDLMENPYYQTYLVEKGIMDQDGNILDEVFFDNMSRNLEQKQTVFTDAANRAALKKDVLNKSRIFDLNEVKNVEDRQTEVDEKGEAFETDIWTIGGETSFSKALREYISLTTIKTTDEYGQDTEEAVYFGKVYRGLTRALAGIEEENVLPRFKSLSEFDEDINAVFNRLTSDLGLTRDGSLDIQNIRPEGYDTWRKFVTAFNNENVAWYTILHSNEQSRLIPSNTNSAKDIQFNDWLQNYVPYFEESKFDNNIRQAIDKAADAVNRTENITVTSLQEAKDKAAEIKQQFRKLSIELSDAYLAYSLLKKSEYGNLDQDGQDMLSAFAGTEGLYDGGNIPYIVTEFKSDFNPFIATLDDKNKERGAVTRLKQIAAQNALFDPTIGENSFQNADGKNVYAIIRPSFGLVKLRRLVDPISRFEILQDEKDKKDNFIDPLSSVTLNHLLANENLDLIMENLSPSMIDGYRRAPIEGDTTAVESGEGVTFGKFSAKEYLLSDMLMFLSNRKALNTISDNGKVIKLGESAMFNINQMEASNTGYGVFLPVMDFGTNGLDKGADILFNYLAQEVIRIAKVKRDFGKGTTWVGYNDKQDARGFKLMEFANYGLEDLISEATNANTAEEVYSKLLEDKANIIAAIRAKLVTDVNDYKKILESTIELSDLPTIELKKRGYLEDKKDAKIQWNKLVIDQYLNAYINTLGINNLLLDNYAKKVKNTVDWYKRAKGIIGSGPDFGTGTTKVAVYQDPVKFIDTKTLATIDKAALVAERRSDLEAEGLLSTDEITKAVKDFEKDLNAGKIDIADAQSYVTLDHKILQLQRLGRFPKEVAAVYNKIMNGETITWGDKTILENNNAALNSTKTVAYNGDYYFKLSELILSPNLVGAKENGVTVMTTIKNNNGQDVPFPAKPADGMEYLYNKYKAMITQGVDQALPATASKMATKQPTAFAEDGNFDFTNSIMEIENKYKRLQVETPSGKSKIIHGTQLIQLITSEQDDSLAVDFSYNEDVKNLGDLRRIYRQLLADNRYEAFSTALAYMKDPKSGAFNSAELANKFYNTIVESGSDEILSNFFHPDQKFNWNLGPIVNKAEQLFLAHFSKGVLSQKVPGLKVSLVSDAGIKIRDKKTGKLRDLQHMVEDADGNYYSECLLPPFANELLGKNPSDERIQEVLKMFGVRIPTDDKHSMISLKVVGFLPVEYGSIGVFPKEIVYLSGADFDIDSEFIHRAEFYTNKEGIPVLYGTEKTPEGKFMEWKNWNLKNNKLLKHKFHELGFSYAKATDEQKAEVFKSLNLPSTLEEFVEKNPINIGTNNNAMLQAQIKFLTNDYVRTKSATTPVSTSAIEDMEEVVTTRLGRNNAGTTSPNSPISRFRANRTNMEGKYGIGPVALANVTQSLLTSYDVRLLNGIDLPNITGNVSQGFTSNFVNGQETIRKTDMLSALLNAMTDNAKLQLADKLTLTFNPSSGSNNSLPVAAYMLGIGYSMDETMLFINQALTRNDLVLDKDLNDRVEKLEDKYFKAVKSATGVDLSTGFVSREDRAKVASFNDNNRKPMSLELLTETIDIDENTEWQDYIHLSEALMTFKAMQSQAGYVSAVSNLMSLNKGLASTFDDNLSLEGVLERLQLNFLDPYINNDVNTYEDLLLSLGEFNIIDSNRLPGDTVKAGKNFPTFVTNRNMNRTPFDARLALLNDANTIQNIIIYKKVMDTSKEFFLMNTPIFSRLRNITQASSKELIPFFMDKANRTFLEELYPEKYQSFMRAEANAAYMIHKSGDQSIGRDLYNLKKDPKFRNNLLIKMLTLKAPSNGSKIVQIEFPTRIKAEGDFYTNLNNAFKELFMTPQTTEFARKLYYYSYFKDGLQFRNKSFINTIPSWVFKDVSSSLDILNADFKTLNIEGYSAMKEGLIPAVIDMFDAFTSVEKFNTMLPEVIRWPRKVTKVALPSSTQSTIYIDDEIKSSIDFTNLRSYDRSVKELAKTTGSADIEALREGIKYFLAGYVKDEFNEQQPEAILGTKGRKLVSAVVFLEGGLETLTLAQLTERYMRTGNLPIAVEATYDKVIPTKESGFNTAINGMSFINSYRDNVKGIKQTEPSIVTENLNVSNEEEVIVSEPEVVENLEIPENNSTFVEENPFSFYSSDDAPIDMINDYQDYIDDSITMDDYNNSLDAEADQFRDANDDLIC